MVERLNVYVPGRPRSQPRGRPLVHCALANKRKGKKCPATIISTMKDDVKAYRSLVMQACKSAAEAQECKELLATAHALRFTLVLWFATKDRGRWGRPHTNVPDLDNVAKLFMDVAVDAGLMPRGDGRVADLHPLKAWNHTAGAMVRIEAIDDQSFAEKMMEMLDVGREPQA